MNVLHVVPTYLPAYRYGGPIESVHALNKYLVRAGAEVTVYTTAIDGPRDLDVPLGASVDHDGVHIFYFKPGWPRFWFYAPDMRRALRAHARDFDVIHITSVFLSASTLGASAARAAGRPYLISPRGSLMRAPLTKRNPFKKSIYMNVVEKKNLENADAIHFTSDLERQEYEASGLPFRKSVVIPNGLDPNSLPPGDPQEFRRKFGIAPEKKIVLSLGRISWKKGFDTLIPTFASVARGVPEAVLVVAGGDDEGYMSTLNRLVEESGARGKIIFTGRLAGALKTAAYRSAEVFALPSYAENFAITAAEAMHCGVPVVVSEEVGLAPVVRASGAGLVVPKDADAVAAALIGILKNSARARQMGEKGIAAAREFSYEKVAARFLGAYNELS